MEQGPCAEDVKRPVEKQLVRGMYQGQELGFRV
jgi:hypothetical protein